MAKADIRYSHNDMNHLSSTVRSTSKDRPPWGQTPRLEVSRKIPRGEPLRITWSVEGMGGLSQAESPARKDPESEGSRTRTKASQGSGNRVQETLT